MIKKKLKQANDLTQKAIQTRRGQKELGQRGYLLAYGYLRGRKYRQLESKTNTPNWEMDGILDFAARMAEVPRELFDLWVESDIQKSTQEIDLISISA